MVLKRTGAAGVSCPGNTLLHCIRKELPVAGPVGGRLGEALKSSPYGDLGSSALARVLVAVRD